MTGQTALRRGDVKNLGQRGRMVRTAAAVFFAMAVSSGAFAQSVTVESYINEKREDYRDFSKIWLDGVYNGLLVASIDMAQDNRGSLFCPPGKMAMTNDQVKSIIDQYLTTHKVQMDWPISVVLLGALKEVFPCP